MRRLRSGWENAGGKTTDVDYQRELTALNQYYATEDSLRSDWLSGAKGFCRIPGFGDKRLFRYGECGGWGYERHERHAY
jgi:hypothetical protein